MVLDTKQAWDRYLLRAVDAGLAGAIFVVPMLMGGRHAIGQLGLTIAAIMAAWAWAARQTLRAENTWRPTTAMPLLVLGVLLLVFQTAPLPPWLLERLSPHATAILPLWHEAQEGTTSLGRWSCISLSPSETRAALIIFLDFALLFFVVAQRVRQIEDVERLLRWCAASAVLMAAFGLLQLVACNGKFFWIYQHPFTYASGGAKGAFANRNHFAQFLALGVGPLIWWLQDAMRRARTRGEKADTVVYLLGLALGVVLFAGLMSLSRGGILAIFMALALSTVVCYRIGSLGRRLVGILAAAGVLLGISLAIFGLESVSNRLDDLSSGSMERLDQMAARRTIWTATLQAVPDYLCFGSGVGTFAQVYPMYTGWLSDADVEFTNAENSYLQVALETGIVGAALLVAGLLLCAFWCVRGLLPSIPSRMRLCAGAIAASLVASAAHAIVDFIWYVPACVATALILAACAARLPRLARHYRAAKGTAVSGQGAGRTDGAIRTHGANEKNASRLIPDTPHPSSFSSGRLRWAIAAVVLLAVGGWMIVDRLGPAVAQVYWEDYLIERHAAENQRLIDKSLVLAEPATLGRWIGCLETVVEWQPTHAGAHLILAELHHELCEQLQATSENPMPLIHISDTICNDPALQSREALLEWLPRGMGKHWTHLPRCLSETRKALSLCPLEGRAYLYLAELSPLCGAGRAGQQACLEQALRLRPFDGIVLSASANQMRLAGDIPRWWDCLKRAFQCGHGRQQQIMSGLVASASPEELPGVIDDILRECQPDLEGLRFLHSICMNRCPAQQLAPLARRRLEAAENEASKLARTAAAAVWVEAYGLHVALDDDDARCFACLQRALDCDSNNYAARYQLGVYRFVHHSYAEAETHLKWCQQRTPDNVNLENLLQACVKGQLDEPRRTAKGPEATVNR